MSEILSHQQGHVLTLTINRPEQLNALNKVTITALSVALEQAEVDDEVRAIIITGSGPKAFVAGADIKEFADFNQEQGKSLAITFCITLDQLLLKVLIQQFSQRIFLAQHLPLQQRLLTFEL